MNKVKLSIFSSGVGTNLLAIHKATMDKSFPGKLEIVICDKICPALKLAKRLNYETKLISSEDNKKFETLVHRELIKKKVELICLAGFMKILSEKFVLKWENKILNIHPSILPNFKGLKAQKQAIDNNVKFSGCTVHFVNEFMDEGEIIDQKIVNISTHDNVDSLSKKILMQEHKLYIKVIKELEKNYGKSK